MSAQLPAWAAIWRSISRAFTSPQEQQAEAEGRRELVARALVYEELVKHPGWALYQEALQALIASTEEALVSRLPFPENGAPTPEWQMLQDIALRGQRQGYVVARELVGNAIAAARELVEESRSRAGLVSRDFSPETPGRSPGGRANSSGAFGTVSRD